MRTRRQRHGIIFITAVMALAVMFTVGIAFIGMASQQMGDSQRDLKALHAVAMADAGINYLVWKQKFSGSPITEIYNAGTDYSYSPPQLHLQLGELAQDFGDVWLLRLNAPSTSQGYEAIARGNYRSYHRVVRAVLQGPIPIETGGDEIPPPPQLSYAVFTKSDLTVETSTNVSGDLGSNGNIVLNTSGGGNLVGNVYAAGGVIFKKNTAFVTGNVRYGTGLYDNRGNDITNSSSGIVSGTSQGGATTQVISTPLREPYAAWASSYGSEAYFNDTRLTDPSRVTTPILFVNSEGVSPFNLDIDADLEGPLTIFVNGDVRLNGNTVLGSPEHPVVLITTGSVLCSGTPDINGVIWANGTFGNGTPTVRGSVICNNLATFQGDVQLRYQSYSGVQIIPPTIVYDNSYLWDITSWELI
ncbi:MAG: polymer-forming cytoskeletal protein [Armatimonadota bacterium]